MAEKRAAEGGAFTSRGKHYARVTVAPKKREAILCPWATTREEALERAKEIQPLVNRLLASGHTSFITNLIENAGAADAEKMAAFARAVDGIAGGTVAIPKKPTQSTSTVITFADWRAKWTDGELARDYPTVVRDKRTSNEDACRSKKWIEPVVGTLPITDITLEHFEDVMRRIPKEMSDSNRLHIAQVMRRVLDLAVYPGKLIATNPIPKMAMPRIHKQKLGRWLYPSEEAKLMAAREVDLGRRLLYGFLTRLGWRKGEAIGGAVDDEGERHVQALTWGAVDLVHGVVNLDKNKTDDPRVVPLGADVVRALTAWRDRWYPGKATPDALVFVQANGANHNRDRLPDLLREDLEQKAKIERAELFVDTSTHDAIDIHDLRATAVTVWLAQGKSERWICDRTGHRSHSMIERYRRPARTVAELGLGPLTDLDLAIPELSENTAAAARAAALGAAVGAAEKNAISVSDESPNDLAGVTDGARTRDIWSHNAEENAAQVRIDAHSRDDENSESTSTSTFPPAAAVNAAPTAALDEIAQCLSLAIAKGDLDLARSLATSLERLTAEKRSDGLARASVVDLAEARRVRK